MMQKIFKLAEKIRIKLMSPTQYIGYLRQQGMVIGEGCDIAKTAIFGNEPWLVKIGDNVRITRNVQFVTHDGGIWTLRKMGIVDKEAVSYGNITIGNNCNISWNVVIMPGVKIGENCVIGTGAIVTKDIPDNSVAVGIPARVVETISEYATKKASDCVPTMHMSEEDKKAYLQKYKPELFNFDK